MSDKPTEDYAALLHAKGFTPIAEGKASAGHTGAPVEPVFSRMESGTYATFQVDRAWWNPQEMDLTPLGFRDTHNKQNQ